MNRAQSTSGEVGLVIRENTQFDANTGRTLRTFRAVFVPDLTASGELEFALWQKWEDEPETHEEARTNALRNARVCMTLFGGAELLNALEIAEATIRRLSTNHGPFNSAQGTLDVITAALAKAKGQP